MSTPNNHLHVGFVLLCHTIRCAFQDGMREYRFGLGAESYKSRFAETDPGLDTVAIAAGARGRLALAAIHAALLMPERVRRAAWQLGGRSAA
jgi:CelD/BcsL family acetyltransferase involved in cellulose biosynthesis